MINKFILLSMLCLFINQIIFGKNFNSWEFKPKKFGNNEIKKSLMIKKDKKRSLKVYGNGSVEQNIYLKPNTEYVMSCYVKSIGKLSQKSKLYLSYSFNKINGITGGMSKIVYGEKKQWYKIEKIFKTKKATNNGTVKIKFQISANDPGNYFIDDFVLKQTNYNKNLVTDGSFENDIKKYSPYKTQKKSYKSRLKNNIPPKKKYNNHKKNLYDKIHNTSKHIAPKSIANSFKKNNPIKKKITPKKKILPPKQKIVSNKKYETIFSNDGTIEESKLIKIKKYGKISNGILNSYLTVKIQNQNIRLKPGKKITYKTKSKKIISGYLDGNQKIHIAKNNFEFADNTKIEFSYFKTLVKGIKNKHYISNGKLATDFPVKIGKYNFVIKKNPTSKPDVWFDKNGFIKSFALKTPKKVKLWKNEYLVSANTTLIFEYYGIVGLRLNHGEYITVNFQNNKIRVSEIDIEFVDGNYKYLKLYEPTLIEYNGKKQTVRKNGRIYFKRYNKIKRIF